MRKKIVLGCVAFVLLALAGLRLFGFIGVGSGATGVQGDPVRFSASSLALRLLKGEPDSLEPNGDTPSVRWRYKDQVAFGRSCSIEYTLDGESPWLERLLFCGVYEVNVAIPIESTQDGNALFDRIYAEMQRVIFRERGYTAEEREPRDGALRVAHVSVTIGPPFLSANIELFEDRVRVAAVSMW